MPFYYLMSDEEAIFSGKTPADISDFAGLYLYCARSMRILLEEGLKQAR